MGWTAKNSFDSYNKPVERRFIENIQTIESFAGFRFSLDDFLFISLKRLCRISLSDSLTILDMCNALLMPRYNDWIFRKKILANSRTYLASLAEMARDSFRTTHKWNKAGIQWEKIRHEPCILKKTYRNIFRWQKKKTSKPDIVRWITTESKRIKHTKYIQRRQIQNTGSHIRTKFEVEDTSKAKTIDIEIEQNNENPRKC